MLFISWSSSIILLAQEIADDLFEGDIILDKTTDPEDRELYSLQKKKKDSTLKDENAGKRQGTRNLKWLWHYKKIPYEISPSLCKTLVFVYDSDWTSPLLHDAIFHETCYAILLKRVVNLATTKPSCVLHSMGVSHTYISKTLH